MSIYLVKEEDTIDKIAGLYDVSVEEIAYINHRFRIRIVWRLEKHF